MESPDLAAASNKRDLYVVVLAILLPSIVTLVYFNLLNRFDPRVQQAAYAIGKTIQFLLPIVFVWCCDRAFLTASRERTHWRSWWTVGLIFGLLVTAGIFVIYFLLLQGSSIADKLTVGVIEKVKGFGIDSFWKFAALGIFYALVHSLLEEYYWRWFVFRYLQKFVSVFAANIISSLGFMAHHVFLLGFFLGWNEPLTYVFSLAVAMGGLFWAWIYDKSGSLLVPWLSHMLVDAGIFSLGYFMIRDAI